jgi:Domain of unknown function (DUF4296)
MPDRPAKFMLPASKGFSIYPFLFPKFFEPLRIMKMRSRIRKQSFTGIRSTHKTGWVILLIFPFFLGACGGISVEKSGIIPEKKLVPFLCDLHLVNAYVSSVPLKDEFRMIDSAGLYQPVFEKYGISQKKFEHTMNYYSRYPEKFEGIYELVIKELTEKEVQVSREPLRPGQQQDNLWDKKKNWRFPEEGERSGLDFKIPLKGLGTYTIQVKIRIFPDDQTVNPRLSAYFWLDDGTSTGIRELFQEQKYNKDGQMTSYSITHYLGNTRFIYLKGKILDHDSVNVSWKMHLLIDDIKVIYTPTSQQVAPE